MNTAVTTTTGVQTTASKHCRLIDVNEL